MTDIQRFRFREPLPTAEHEKQANQSVEVNEAPPVKRLDGEVTRLAEIPFGEGVCCEVWRGEWKKGRGEGIDGKRIGGKGVGREKVDVEKVSLSPTASILLMLRPVGGLENAPSTQVTREGTQGSTFFDCL